ncbi:hypothetical protein SCLCIDRAFT_1217984 [Scleroderma citrinum Foug A]|uniref:Uncharacterized protein n=1 Tax=Scleroderma citrinum Foug A TaxID=1036808 RepID=A0A0C3DSL9_9AGAM|nr:hypothetical protein SCLCIDRAFT_1217984 [Scleroderma citrinum Foug A]
MARPSPFPSLQTPIESLHRYQPASLASPPSIHDHPTIGTRSSIGRPSRPKLSSVQHSLKVNLDDKVRTL